MLCFGFLALPGNPENPAERRLRCCEISVPNLGWDFAVFLKELAQIRKEEKEKKRRRLENIRSLKGMGYSMHAAQQALHAASGNLDEALKVAAPSGPLALSLSSGSCPELPPWLSGVLPGSLLWAAPSSDLKGSFLLGLSPDRGHMRPHEAPCSVPGPGLAPEHGACPHQQSPQART